MNYLGENHGSHQRMVENEGMRIVVKNFRNFLYGMSGEEWIMAQRHQTLDLRKYTASHAAINELPLGCIEANQGDGVKPSSTMDEPRFDPYR